MKHLFLLLLALTVLLLGLPGSARAAKTNEQQQLIAVIKSDASLSEKDAACARLKRIGTDKSIPTLAALLVDEQLSHSARYALESMPSSKAGRALTVALGKTSGLTRVGIINSLGMRGEKGAVSALAKLVTDQDDQAAAAAARALGQIGTTKALKALRHASADSANPAHHAIVDAWLRAAQQMLAAGEQSRALEIFQALYDQERADSVRTAAYRGMILSSGKKGLPLMVRAILGKEGASQTAALQLVREVTAPDATKTFGVLLNKVPPARAGCLN